MRGFVGVNKDFASSSCSENFAIVQSAAGFCSQFINVNTHDRFSLFKLLKMRVKMFETKKAEHLCSCWPPNTQFREAITFISPAHHESLIDTTAALN
ncbi:hypothetical protein L0244_31875 [bacterium]|nr:hypothetical protein [bacterium]